MKNDEHPHQFQCTISSERKRALHTLQTQISWGFYIAQSLLRSHDITVIISTRMETKLFIFVKKKTFLEEFDT